MDSEYGRLPGPLDVVRWPLGGFGERLAAAIKGDSWASPLFVRDAHLEQNAVLFFLRFEPGRKARNAGGDSPVGPSKLLVCSLGPTDRPREEVACTAWIENSEGIVSAKSERKLEFPCGEAGVGWDAFLTAAQLDALEVEEAVTICVRFPFEFSRLRTTSANYTFKWDYGSIWERIGDMREDDEDVGDAQDFRLLSTNAPKFRIDFDVRGDDWTLRLAVQEPQKYAKVYARYVQWFEKCEHGRNEGRDKPRTSMREGYLLVTKEAEQHAHTNVYSRAECSVLPPHDCVNICCTITALRVESTPFEPDGLRELQKTLERAALNDEHADFAFKTKDGQEFKAPSYLFALHSPYFREFLERKDGKQPLEFLLDDGHEPAHVRALTGFLYHGKVEKLGEIAADLYRLARRYRVEDLEEMCLIQLCRALKVENFLTTVSFAFREEGTDQLRDYAVRYGAAKAKAIRELPAWEEFANFNPKIYAALLKAGFKIK